MEDNLQFERAEPKEPTATACAMCGTPLQSQYYQAMGKVVCESCAGQVRQFAEGTGSGMGRFAKALVLGLGAMIAGTLVYGGVMIYAHVEWALITVAIGWLVGRGVRTGSGHRGGWRYQSLAAFLTYSSIAFAYLWKDSFSDMSSSLEDVIEAIPEAYMLPIRMQDVSDIVSLLIVGFGVWEAWRVNRKLVMEVTGPHALGTGPQSAHNAGA